MKFIVSKDLEQSSLIRVLSIFFLFALLLFFIFQPFVEKESLGLTADQILKTIGGDESLFMPALSFDQLLEKIHIDLFFRIIAALCVLALCVRLIKSKKTLIFFIFTLNLSILTNALSPLVILAGWSAWASVKMVAFWGQEIVFLSLISFCLFRLLRSSFGLSSTR